MKSFLVAATIQEMTSTGGLLIVAIGLNMLGMTRIRVGNMLPAIFMPLIYFASAVAAQSAPPGIFGSSPPSPEGAGENQNGGRTWRIEHLVGSRRYQRTLRRNRAEASK
jgi:hypothetical protein